VSNVAAHHVVFATIVADSDETSVRRSRSNVISDSDVSAGIAILQSTDGVTSTLVNHWTIKVQGGTLDNATDDIVVNCYVLRVLSCDTEWSELENNIVVYDNIGRHGDIDSPGVSIVQSRVGDRTEVRSG